MNGFQSNIWLHLLYLSLHITTYMQIPGLVYKVCLSYPYNDINFDEYAQIQHIGKTFIIILNLLSTNNNWFLSQLCTMFYLMF